MGAVERIIVDGHPFIFADIFNASGVLVEPDDASPENPEWMAAFDHALTLQGIWARLLVVEMFSAKYGIDVAHLPEDELHSHLTDIEALLDGELEHLATVTDVSEAMVLSTKQEIEAELQRRVDKERRMAQKQARQVIREAGYVYLIQSSTGAYKIGRTVNPDNRMRTFHVKLPFEVEYVAVIPTPDMRGLESDLHRRYADKRVNGEWFKLDAADVATIKALAEVQS